MQIGVKRAYDEPAEADGRRILVDRVWPRGAAKSRLRLDDWIRDVAPSAALRKWFNHDPARWDMFRERYFRELDDQPRVVDSLVVAVRSGPVTLVYGARDERHNNAVALKEYIEGRAKR